MSMLLAASAAAQLIPLLTTPLITRLYTSVDYGEYAWAQAAVNIAVTIAGAKYELAVCIPSDDKEAHWLVWGAILLGMIGATLGLLGGTFGTVFFGCSPFWLWFLPGAILSMVSYGALSAWATRKGEFNALIAARLAMASSTVGLTVACGYSKAGAEGLMIGQVGGFVVGGIVLYTSLHGINQTRLNTGLLRDSFNTLKRHWSTPAYLLPSTLINTVANQVPVWCLGAFFGNQILGQYNLVQRVLNACINLLSSTFGEVFKNRSSEEWHTNGSCPSSFARFLTLFAIVAFFPSIALGLLGPELFSFVFGHEWEQAGVFAQLLSVLFFCRIVVSPLTFVAILANKQRINLLFQTGTVAVTIAPWIIPSLRATPELALGIFAGGYIAIYLAYFAYSHSLARGRTSGKEG